MKKTILITGSSGFIGSHLIKKISKYNTPIEKSGKKIGSMLNIAQKNALVIKLIKFKPT